MKRILIMLTIVIAPVVMSLLLIFGVMAAIPIVEDEDALVSRLDVLEYFESMQAVEATRDKALLERLYPVLEQILETATQASKEN